MAVGARRHAARSAGAVLQARLKELQAENARLRRRLAGHEGGPAFQAAEILESIDDAFYALDRELRFTYANSHALRHWARDTGQVIGRHAFDVFPQGRGTQIHQALLAALESRKPLRFEWLSTIVSRWLAVSIYPSEQGITVYFRDISEQKAVEATLRESEERYRSLFESANDAIILIDLATRRYVDWNPRVEELTGYGPDELGRMRLGDLVPPEARERIAARLGRLRPDESVILAYELARKDGSRVPVELSARAVRVKGAVRVQAIMRDMSERAAAAQALRDGEERLRLAVEVTGLGIWDIDLRRGTRRWSDEYKAILGLPPDTRPDPALVAAAIHPEDRERVNALYHRAYEPESGGRYEAGFRIIRADDGAERWVLNTGRVYFDEAGRPVRAIGTMHDVTDRRMTEGALRESEERYRALVETSPDAVLAHRDGVIILANRQAALLFGAASPEALIGRTVFDLVAPESLARTRARSEALAARGGRAELAELVYRRLDGTPFPVEAAAAAVMIERRPVIQVVFRDISERKLAEQRQQLLLQELAHRVKNTLAVVQGIAVQSISGERSLEEARDVFVRRLRALAGAHGLLTGSEWRGASLHALVLAELSPYGQRTSIAGEEIVLAPRAALTLSLVLHELATNAAKYGALSVPGGNVALAWGVACAAGRRSLRLTWREHGGPEVRRPARHGFGRMLIEQAVAHELDGRTRLDFLPTGFVYELWAPLALCDPSGA